MYGFHGFYVKHPFCDNSTKQVKFGQIETEIFSMSGFAKHTLNFTQLYIKSISLTTGKNWAKIVFRVCKSSVTLNAPNPQTLPPDFSGTSHRNKVQEL